MFTGRGTWDIAGGGLAGMMLGIRSPAPESRFWFLWQNGVTTDFNTPGFVTVNPAGLYGLGVTTDGFTAF
jgi:hypothetical protein